MTILPLKPQPKWILKSGAPSTPARRLLAQGIDFALGIALIVLAFLRSASLIIEGGYRIGSESNGQQVLAAGLVLLAYAGLYKFIMGQSLGAALLGLRHARRPERNPGRFDALLVSGALIFALIWFLPLKYFPRDSEQALSTRASRARSELGTALAFYWADHIGKLPAKIEVKDLVPTYVPSVPALDLHLPGSKPSQDIEVYSFTDKKGNVDSAKLKDTGHWALDPKTGMTIIDSKVEWLGKKAFEIGLEN